MIKKLIISGLIIITTIIAVPIGASAEWKHDSKGSWYTEGESYATGWRKLKHYGGASWEQESWYFFDDDGYVKTGWIQDGGNWYYAYPSANFIATDRYVDGYYLDSNGILTSDTSNATVKESDVKATLEIAKRLENSGWVKTGTYIDANAELTPKTQFDSINTRCTIKDGLAKVLGVTCAQNYEEWSKKTSEKYLDLTLDEYLKYKDEGRIGSFSYKYGMSYPLQYTELQEYLRNESTSESDKSISIDKSKIGNWNSDNLDKNLKK